MSLLDLSPAAIERREKRFLVGNYNRTPFHPRWGKGAKLYDAKGRTYWDLLAGIAVNALGHQHPKIVRVLRKEAESLLHVSNLYFHPAQGLLAEKLVKASGLARVFFCNSGTEANEAALKFARLKNPGRPEVAALLESFHGRTLGALSLTGHAAYRKPFGPLVPKVKFVPPNDITALRKVVSKKTAAIFLEPILGEGGIIPLSRPYLQAARRLADASGALLVFDEIQCGLGRMGRLFAFQKFGVRPDIVTLAKPLGGGLPLGAVLLGPTLNGTVKPGHHGTTFGGNPLACWLGLTVLEEIQRKRLLPRIQKLGQWLKQELAQLKKRCPAIVEVRGAGLMWGIELNREATPVAQALLAKGFVVGTARERVIRLLPPYVVPQKALRDFIQTLEKILKEEK